MAAIGLKLSKKSQEQLLAYCLKILDSHRGFTELRAKMEAIDVAYARYTKTQAPEDGKQACDVFASDDIVPPIVVSQVDSYVAYLCDVFLSGTPIFPIVSTPKNRKYAEQLETLIDDHATLAGYPRQLMLFIRAAVKYNVGAVEADWDSLSEFTVVNSFMKQTKGNTVDQNDKFLTRLRAMDMYNTIWDRAVPPADVSREGDYAGYVERLSQTKILRLMNKLKAQGVAYNIPEAMKQSETPAGSSYYVKPQISDYVSPKTPENDWNTFFGDKKVSTSGATGELQTLYLRIVPKDFGIIAPRGETLQIWKVRILNGSLIISTQRILSAYDHLPILFSQPLEDGMEYQTQSVAEMQIPIQKAASTLFNIRFSAARRSVSDRALYNPEMISPKDVNTKAAAPKIPVRINPLSANQSLDNAYRPIPFDMRGTESALGDMAALVGFSQQLSGVNAPMQGQFQRGNKSVQEWQDTMGGADSRLRLAALCMEHQAFIWMKFIIVLNIYQYGQDTIVVSQRTGEEISISIAELRQHVLSFRVADGYNPKAKLASVDMITAGMNMIMNSPQLQQKYGSNLPGMFAHLMQLGGVRGLEEYDPAHGQEQAAPQLQAPQMQAPMEPSPEQLLQQGAGADTMQSLV